METITKTPNELIKKGEEFTIEVKGQKIKASFSHMAPNGMAYLKGEDGKGYERSVKKLLGHAADSISFAPTRDIGEITLSLPEQFDINQKFKFLGSLVRMVLKNQNSSVLITGEGGLGKTHEVNTQVEIMGLRENHDYFVYKGYTTAKGLYKILYDHSEHILVFDDFDEALDNEISKNLLKAALDSYDKRILTWNSTSLNDELPSQFEFKGRIIFISNLSRKKISQAIVSRCLSIDLSMTVNDKIMRMRNILPNIMTGVPIEQRLECMDIIENFKDRCSDLNMRTLKKIIAIRTSGEEDWKEMAEFMLLS